MTASPIAAQDLVPGIGRRLHERGATIAVAESCTGGYIADQLTNCPGASAWFCGGVVAYSNAMKSALLGVAADLLATHGAVSGEAAAAMAEGVRRVTGATFGLAVTGIAGPTGGTPSHPVGTVYIALATSAGTEAVCHNFPRERRAFKMIVGARALDMVVRSLG